MQSGTVGTRLVFFLFLLIPGYAAVRSYLWANIALDDTTRLTKLVLMSIGGFASLAIVSVIRKLWGWDVASYHDSELLRALTINEELTLSVVSNLSVLESTALIVSQSLIAIVGGVLVGASRVVLIDAERDDRQQLQQPWEELYNQIRIGDELTVITHSGEKITGNLKQIGNPPREHDLILTNPKKAFIDTYDHSENDKAGPMGELSYHHQQDISRVIAHREWTEAERGKLNATYMRSLQWGLYFRDKIIHPRDTISGITSYGANLLSKIRSDSEQEETSDKLDLSPGYRIERIEDDNGQSIRIEAITEKEEEGKEELED
ncbi:hypothetical protein G3A49_13360 [Haloferax volcanii]|uniref:Uncharacterized protein n=1 Tax=Haloferax volcanii TaxID=2246 RepID=A0A6C0UV64_HALVO|nr:hypothetical protein [Haloferax alexandrinus]QIB79067.1 hypothetical protein G3A49_13360 [Haloferax alexandrinus]